MCSNIVVILGMNTQEKTVRIMKNRIRKRRCKEKQ